MRLRLAQLSGKCDLPMNVQTLLEHPYFLLLYATCALQVYRLIVSYAEAFPTCLYDSDTALFVLFIIITITTTFGPWTRPSNASTSIIPTYGLSPTETATGKGLLTIAATYGYLYAPRGSVYEEVGLVIWGLFAFTSSYCWTVAWRTGEKSSEELTSKFVCRLTVLLLISKLWRPDVAGFKTVDIFSVDHILLSHGLAFAAASVASAAGLRVLFGLQAIMVTLFVFQWMPTEYEMVLWVEIVASYGAVAALASGWRDIVQFAALIVPTTLVRSQHFAMLFVAVFIPCYVMAPRDVTFAQHMPSYVVLAGRYSLELCLLSFMLRPHSRATHPSVVSLLLLVAQAFASHAFKKLSRIDASYVCPLLLGLHTVLIMDDWQRTLSVGLMSRILWEFVAGLVAVTCAFTLARYSKGKKFLSLVVVMLSFKLLLKGDQALHWEYYADCSQGSYAISKGEALVASPPYHSLNEAQVSGLLRDQQVVFVGDSIMRYVYFGVRRSIDNSLGFPLAKYHSDLDYENTTAGTKLYFHWAPYVSNLANITFTKHSYLAANTTLLVGNGPWDALHTRDAEHYGEQLRMLQAELCQLSGRVKSMLWLSFGNIVDEKLLTPEKRTWLNSRRAAQYRRQVLNSGILDCFDATVDMEAVTRSRSEDCLDGIHYSERTYTAAAQLFLNLLR